MSLTEFVIGLSFLVGTLLPISLAAWMLTRRAFGHLTGVPRVLCFALIAVTGIIVVHMVPGVLGFLSRTAVLVVSVLVGGLACLWAARREPSFPPDLDASLIEAGEPDGGPAIWLTAAIVTGVVVYVLGYVILTRNQVVTGTDAMWFHIPTVARWIQTGTFWDVQSTWSPGWAFGHYPNNGNVVQLTFVLPWSSDAFIRFISIPFLGLAGLSVYALARELRAPRSTSAVAAAVFCTIPVAMRPALRAGQTDTILVAAFGIGLVFLLRYSRSRERPDLVLAGLGLGIAFGTKWYAVTYVPIVIAVWVVASLVARRPFRQTLLHGAALSGIVFAAGGFWLVRNLVKSGSPLFPAKVALGGVTIFDAPPSHVLENGGYSIGHYLDQSAILRRIIVPQLSKSFAVSGILLGLTLGLVCAFVLSRRGRSRSPAAGSILALSITGVLILIAYIFTPFSAFGPKGRPVSTAAGARYALPALLIAAAVAAWGSGRARGLWRTGFVALGGLCILESLRRTDAIARADFTITPRLVGYGVAASLFVALVAALVRRIVRRQEPPTRGRLAWALAIVIVLASLTAAAGYRQQRAYNLVRYRSADPVFEWVQLHAPSGHRIGLAGRYPFTTSGALPPPLPLHGPRLRNEVVYVGPTVRGLLGEYEAREPFVAALARGDFELLVVALGDPPQPTAPQEEWAESAGFVEVVRSPYLVLLARQAR